MQWYQHEATRRGLARVQDHDDLLEMVRLHFEAARAVDGELALGRRAPPLLEAHSPVHQYEHGPHHRFTGHVQDHLLTNRHVDLLPARSGLPVRDGDVDGQCVVIS